MDDDEECPDSWHLDEEGGDQWCPTCEWCEVCRVAPPHCECRDLG
jgi:hypothetical protein